MAVERNYLKCTMCGVNSLIRCQIGPHTYTIPIKIPCSECKGIIEGTLEVREGLPVAYNFRNAEIIYTEDLSDAEVELEVSGEFPVKMYTKDVGVMRTTPFMNYISQAGEDAFELVSRMLTLHTTRTIPAKQNLKDSLEYYKNGNYFYMEKCLKKSFPIDLSQKDFDRKISFIDVLFLALFENTFFLEADFSRTTRDYYFEIINSNYDEINRLSQSKLDLNKTIDDGIEVVFDFLDNIEEFFPVLSIYYSGKRSKRFLQSNEYRLSTFDFKKSEKHFQDLYEWLNKALCFIVVLENIKIRNDFELCCNKVKVNGKSVETISDFQKLNNGLKKEYTKNFTKLNEIHESFKVNNQLRNSIGHNAINFNSLTQIITYFPYTKPEKKHISKNMNLQNYAFKMLMMYKDAMRLLYVCGMLDLAIQGSSQVSEEA